MKTSPEFVEMHHLTRFIARSGMFDGAERDPRGGSFARGPEVIYHVNPCTLTSFTENSHRSEQRLDRGEVGDETSRLGKQGSLGGEGRQFHDSQTPRPRIHVNP